MTWLLICCALLGFALGVRIAFAALFVASLLTAFTWICGFVLGSWPGLASGAWAFCALALLQGGYLAGAYFVWAGSSAAARMGKGRLVMPNGFRDLNKPDGVAG